MEYILYLIIVGITFCSGAKFCPDVIIANDVFSFIMAIAAYSFVSAYLAILVMNALASLIVKKPNKNESLTIIVIGSIVTMVTSLLSLEAVETIIPNFQIIGVYAKIILAFIATISISLICYHNSVRQ